MEIITCEVEEKLKELKPLKLEGQDNLSPQVLKELAHEIACPAARILNKAANRQYVTTEKQTSCLYSRKGKEE